MANLYVVYNLIPLFVSLWLIQTLQMISDELTVHISQLSFAVFEARSNLTRDLAESGLEFRLFSVFNRK